MCVTIYTTFHVYMYVWTDEYIYFNVKHIAQDNVSTKYTSSVSKPRWNYERRKKTYRVIGKETISKLTKDDKNVDMSIALKTNKWGRIHTNKQFRFGSVL